MSNRIPDKYVRKAFLTLLAGIGTPVYETKVPKSVQPPPAQRVLISTQNNSQHDTSKCGHLWYHSILLDIISENDNGFSQRDKVDDILDTINQIIDVQADIAVDGFTLYNTQVVDIHDMDLDTATKFINRKLVRYQFLIA